MEATTNWKVSGRTLRRQSGWVTGQMADGLVRDRLGEESQLGRHLRALPAHAFTANRTVHGGVVVTDPNIPVWLGSASASSSAISPPSSRYKA